MAKTIYYNSGKKDKLSEDQIILIDHIIDFHLSTNKNKLLIDAIPGAGKTTTICSVISYLIDYYDVDPLSISLITYTKNASQQMKYILKRYTSYEIKYVGTIHSLGYQYILNKNNKLLEHSENENNYYSPCEILANFYKYLTDIQKNKITSDILNLKYIFIDEYQDLDEKQLKIIDLIQTITNCKIVFFGDIDQSIYQFRNSINTLSNNYFQLIDKHSLVYNYRSPQNIINLANKLLKYKYLNIINLDKSIETKQIKCGSMKNEYPVTIIGFKNLSEELEYIISKLKLIDYTNKKILILSRYRFPLTILENYLVKNNIEYINLDDTKYIRNGKISISTIHGAKGLEADSIILINSGNIDIQSEESDQYMIEELNLLYVAITRAKKDLLITYHYKLHRLLEYIIDDTIEHIKPIKLIKPIIYPKNNYISYGVTETVKRMTLKDYENIKTKYKITSCQVKVHKSLKEITKKNSLNIIDFLNEKISGTLPVIGNYIDHYIGYLVAKTSSYHPDLQHIKLIDYIGRDNNIYKFIYGLDKKINEYIIDIKNNYSLDQLKEKYNDVYKLLNMNQLKWESMTNVFKNIILNNMSDNLLDFIQLNPMKMNLSPIIKNYLTYNDKILNENKDNDLCYKTIFVNSLLTSIIQGKTSYEYLITQIKQSMFNDIGEKEWFNEIKEWVLKAKYDVYQKTLHGQIYNGIIDLYSSESKTITDIKCSYTEYIPSQYIIQLLYYYMLALETGLEVTNTHKLYLPITGMEITYKFEKL